MMFLLWIPFVIVAFMLGSLALRSDASGAGVAPRGSTPASDTASEILRRRLALGEITPAQYEEMRRTLGV
jgi:uncharacterized membrane protein